VRGFDPIPGDFKPANVDLDQVATLEVGANDDVTLDVPSDGGATTFRGSQKPHLKECVLIIDHKTGEITIERLGSQMQLKKTRSVSHSRCAPVVIYESDPSVIRLFSEDGGFFLVSSFRDDFEPRVLSQL
jgi:ELL-associated factor